MSVKDPNLPAVRQSMMDFPNNFDARRTVTMSVVRPVIMTVCYAGNPYTTRNLLIQSKLHKMAMMLFPPILLMVAWYHEDLRAILSLLMKSSDNILVRITYASPPRASVVEAVKNVSIEDQAPASIPLEKSPQTLCRRVRHQEVTV
jgi:hypothetical protein